MVGVCGGAVGAAHTACLARAVADYVVLEGPALHELKGRFLLARTASSAGRQRTDPRGTVLQRFGDITGIEVLLAGDIGDGPR